MWYPSIHTSTLACLSLPSFLRKCVSGQAREHNSLEHARFQLQLAALFHQNPQLGARMLMSCDEAVKNKRTSARKYGWSLKGMRCVQRRHFVHGKRYSILPILTLDGIIAYDIIPGSVTLEKFVDFLRKKGSPTACWGWGPCVPFLLVL